MTTETSFRVDCPEFTVSEVIPEEVNNVEKTSPVVSIFLGFQALLAQVINLLYPVALNVLPVLCLLPDDPIRAHIISLTLVMSSLSTMLQCYLGAKLPVLANPSVVYLSAIVIALREDLECPTTGTLYALGPMPRYQEFKHRLELVCGALLLASIFNALLSLTGIFGLLSKYVSTATSTSVILAWSLSNILKSTPGPAGIPLLTILLILLFVVYLQRIQIPVPVFINGANDCNVRTENITMFRLFPILIPLFIEGIIYIVTSKTKVLKTNEEDVIKRAIDSTWFPISFIDIFSWPAFSLKYTCYMTVIMLVQNFISVSTFKMTSDISGRNMGWMRYNFAFGVDAICGICSSLIGVPVSMSADPSMIGLMAITNIKSRLVPMTAACWMLVLAILAKPLILLSLIPIEIFHGLNIILQAILLGKGLSTIKTLSSRKTTMVAISVTVGIIVSKSFELGKYYVLFDWSVLVTGLVCFCLDLKIWSTLSNKICCY